MNADTRKHRSIGEDTGERYTHDRKGGTYRVVCANAKMKIARNDQWVEAVVYADVYGGQVYCTGKVRWDLNFSIMPGPGYVNQD